MRLALFYSLDDVPVKGVVRPKWHDIVVETGPRGCPRINRLNYEICGKRPSPTPQVVHG